MRPVSLPGIISLYHYSKKARNVKGIAEYICFSQIQGVVNQLMVEQAINQENDS